MYVKVRKVKARETNTIDLLQTLKTDRKYTLFLTEGLPFISVNDGGCGQRRRDDRDNANCYPC